MPLSFRPRPVHAATIAAVIVLDLISTALSWIYVSFYTQNIILSYTGAGLATFQLVIVLIWGLAYIYCSRGSHDQELGIFTEEDEAQESTGKCHKCCSSIGWHMKIYIVPITAAVMLITTAALLGIGILKGRNDEDDEHTKGKGETALLTITLLCLTGIGLIASVVVYFIAKHIAAQTLQRWWVSRQRKKERLQRIMAQKEEEQKLLKKETYYTFSS